MTNVGAGAAALNSFISIYWLAYQLRFVSQQMVETDSITYHTSLAVSQNYFSPFSVKIFCSFHSSQDDVLSDSYSGVTERAL